MRLTSFHAARPSFLARVVRKECAHLMDTDRRLFVNFPTEEEARRIEVDPILAERLDAFVSRFGRLQDTVGDKLLPALLAAQAEKLGSAIENLDRAEKLGLIESADTWLVMRKLRNQIVHEHIEDLAVLSSALRGGHDFVPHLVAASRRCANEAERLLSS